MKWDVADAPEVRFEEIAIDLRQDRFWTAVRNAEGCWDYFRIADGPGRAMPI
jgi:hypothetical protein